MKAPSEVNAVIEPPIFNDKNSHARLAFDGASSSGSRSKLQN